MTPDKPDMISLCCGRDVNWETCDKVTVDDNIHPTPCYMTVCACGQPQYRDCEDTHASPKPWCTICQFHHDYDTPCLEHAD